MLFLQTFIWSHLEGIGLEHLAVEPGRAESVVIGAEQGSPYRLAYDLAWDDKWRVHSARFSLIGQHGRTSLALRSDGNGHWFDELDRRLDEFTGATDIDIMVTPMTNTLPIRRLDLQDGESREISVVYVAIPSLSLSRQRQLYSRLGSIGKGRHEVRFESLAGGFSAILVVDDQGWVLDYPGVFRRV